MTNWFESWRHRYEVEAALHGSARAAISRLDSEVGTLRSLLRRERELSADLTGQLVTLKREGFTPPPPEIEGASRVEQPDGWADVSAAILERSGGNPKLVRLMQADARTWLTAEVPVKDIINRIYAGWAHTDD